MISPFADLTAHPVDSAADGDVTRTCRLARRDGELNNLCEEQHRLRTPVVVELTKNSITYLHNLSIGEKILYFIWVLDNI